MRKDRGSILAISLRNENEYLGAFWIAFEGHHIFSDEEIQYYKALAVQASLAATNSRLYLEAEVGRQRLESVLESAPEPVLVFDEKMCLQILNPAAMQISDFILSSEPGTHVSNVFGLPEFRKFLEQPFEEHLISKEIGLPDGASLLRLCRSDKDQRTSAWQSMYVERYFLLQRAGQN